MEKAAHKMTASIIELYTFLMWSQVRLCSSGWQTLSNRTWHTGLLLGKGCCSGLAEHNVINQSLVSLDRPLIPTPLHYSTLSPIPKKGCKQGSPNSYCVNHPKPVFSAVLIIACWNFFFLFLTNEIFPFLLVYSFGFWHRWMHDQKCIFRSSLLHLH